MSQAICSPHFGAEVEAGLALVVCTCTRTSPVLPAYLSSKCKKIMIGGLELED